MIAELADKKILIICESPNKVAHIRDYIKAAGYKNITVMASVGHIANIQDNKKSYKNSGIYPDEDFKADFAVTQDKKSVVQSLKAAADSSDFVYLFSDPDREGSQISWSLVKFLKLPKTKYRRIVTHEITPKAVVYAFEHPIALETNLIEAAQTRAIIDKLIGYGLTPEARVYLGVRSVGRCQSIGLKLVADRETEINNFIPETYYELYLNFIKNGTKFKAKLDHADRITDQASLTTIINSCGPNFVIEDVQRKQKQESPKPPFCTATFQQEAANRLGLSVKEAISAAQHIFEAGKISYHRTDDTKLSSEFLPELQKYIEATYGKKAFVAPRKAKKSANDQNGHEALRVTDPALTPDLYEAQTTNKIQASVYRLIWQRTIASAMPNALIAETKYIINNNGNKFILVSNELVDPGYKKIYTYDDKTEAPLIKETFNKTEKLEQCTLDPQQKTTTPPARFTEASLVQKLKDLGIGRPSTYATIVETVLSTSRGYAELDNKKIVPTQRGMELAKYLDRAFPKLINLNYTKEMEEQLDLIAAGKETKSACLTRMYAILEDEIGKNHEPATVTSAHAEKICPECGAKLAIKRSKYGKLFYGCTNYPKCLHCEGVS